MGVDFFPCTNCGEVFADCGDYVRCQECCEKFCCDECADLKFVDDDTNDQPCKFCRFEDATDSDLLYALLLHFAIDRNAAIEILKKQSENESA